MNEHVIEPVHFIDTENSTINKKDEEEPKLKFNCKYGNVEINLSELPIIGELLG